MLKYSFSLFFLLFSLIFADNGYVIDNYNIRVNISEKNVYSVDEKIEVDFSEARRGIYRVIPEEFNGRKIEISNIRTNVQTLLKRERNYIYLRLGNQNEYVRGIKNYIIKYDYNLGWNRNTKYDEVYYNLIGNDWDTDINKLQFVVTLPKQFDASKINFTVGKYGSISTVGVRWKVDKNSIIGETTRVLKPGESVTLALPLPSGYFDVTEEKNRYYAIKTALYLIYILIPLIAFIINRKYRDKKEVVETVEFYPPDKMTPTEIGYYSSGRVEGKYLTSLIFYWASKGYLEIDETKDSNTKTKNLKLIGLKNMDSDKKEYEKYLFNHIFSDQNFKSKQVVELKSLKNKFYIYIEKAKEIFRIDLSKEHKTLYTYKSLQLENTVRNLSVITLALTIFYFLYFQIQEIGTISFAILSIFLTIHFSKKIRQRTQYANSIVGRILGFKRFLATTEKQKLEMLLEENPSYFYDILPYTIVLGVSDIWANKFKDLVTSPPDWYRISSVGDAFVLGMFMSNFNNSFSSFNNTLLSSPPKAPSNFGGGSSSYSGGSSGGGAGGGGGGSW